MTINFKKFFYDHLDIFIGFISGIIFGICIGIYLYLQHMGYLPRFEYQGSYSSGRQRAYAYNCGSGHIGYCIAAIFG